MSQADQGFENIERRLNEARAKVREQVSDGSETAAVTVLAAYPEFVASEEAAIEIIYAEYVALEEAGRRPNASDWLRRYPKHAARLERLLKLHELLAEPVAEPDSESTPLGSQWVPREISVASESGLTTARSEHSTTPRIESKNAPLDMYRSDSHEAAEKLESFGNYALLGEIGRGGMGVVYRAWQRGLGREVAIKVLRSLNTRPNEWNRFQREAESIASLEHKNIVQVFEAGVHNDVAYLAMEYVRGGSLEQSLRTRAWSNHEIASLVKRLADAMHEAHQKGIIHRDLKPANILMTEQGEPKIADFGLAKRSGDLTNFRTNTGTLIGTPCYMSPEQAKGQNENIGPKTDLYSLGVILYELLTGRLPFQGESSVETLHKIVHDEAVLPSKIKRHVSRDLETICLKCLAKKPEQRYSTSAALAEDLDRFLDHRPILARRSSILERTARRIQRHPQVASLVALLVLLALGGVSVFAWQQRRLESLRLQSESQKISASVQQNRALEAEAAYETSLRKARELVGRWTQLGLKLDNEPGMDELRRKAFEDAVAYYEEFLANHQEDPTIRSEAAQASMRASIIHIELGLWSLAEKGLRRTDTWLSELPPDDKTKWMQADCLIHLAHVERRLERWLESERDYQRAIAILQELHQTNPKRTDYLLKIANAKINLAVVLRFKQRWDESLTAYMEALRMGISAIQIQSGIQDWEPESTSGEKDVAAQVADLVRQSQRIRQTLAKRDLSKLKLLAKQIFFSELAMSFDDLGDVLKQQYMGQSAERCVREAIDLRKLTLEYAPELRRIEQYLARSETHLGSLLADNGNYEEASLWYRESNERFGKLCKDFPNRYDYRSESAYNLVQWAKCSLSKTDYAAAIDAASKSVQTLEQLVASMPDITYLKSELTSSLIVLARALQGSGDREAASQHFQRSITIDPENSNALNTYAWMLALDLHTDSNDIKKSVELASKAVAIAPKNGSFWNTYALSLYRDAQYPQALDAIEQSIELSKGGTTLDWFLKSMISSQLGDSHESRSWFGRAESRRMAQSPGNVELQRFSSEARRLLAELEH
jgi:serine/threonine protein kinase